MGSTAGAAVLMVAVAILILLAFVVLWVRDKGRADEVSDDPARIDTDTHLDTDVREGAADEPPEIGRERRH